MLIGQISELSGYSQRMIRYLEDQGLIHPDRSESNLRRFKDSDLTRVLKIRRLKELGFTYAEIRELVDQDEEILSSRGVELLKRHHADASDLFEKIRQLEMICHGEIKTHLFANQLATYVHPLRTAYRIQKLGEVWRDISPYLPNCQVDVGLWKFGELRNEDGWSERKDADVFEVFKSSSIMAILSGAEHFSVFLKAFEKNRMKLGAESIGKFACKDLSEFYARSEVVINYKILDEKNEVVFQALLSYQAVFIASGEAFKG